MTVPRFRVGIDVGSTTVKAVVVDAQNDEILWKDYRRHETRQVETLLDFLRRMESGSRISARQLPRVYDRLRREQTGDLIGAKYVQEVLAASLTVEQNCPEASSFVEIGGQDAKIVILSRDPETGRIKKTLSMNDKCAGGTGAVIDKISMKLGIPLENICQLRYSGIRLHPVAGKCGVFAETDINGLQKQGIPAAELMASLRRLRAAKPERAGTRRNRAPAGAPARRAERLYPGSAKRFSLTSR